MHYRFCQSVCCTCDCTLLLHNVVNKLKYQKIICNKNVKHIYLVPGIHLSGNNLQLTVTVSETAVLVVYGSVFNIYRQYHTRSDSTALNTPTEIHIIVKKSFLLTNIGVRTSHFDDAHTFIDLNICLLGMISKCRGVFRSSATAIA